jgi:OPA family glycerol-3-phosphate transporter-like MFS transporter
MINLGRVVANKLLPALLAGFVFLGMWHVPPQHWRMLFWIPAGVATLMAIVLAFVVKDTPEEAGYKDVFAGEADHADGNIHGSLSVVFRMIVTNPVVWVIAVAYGCTGAVRQSTNDRHDASC